MFFNLRNEPSSMKREYSSFFTYPLADGTCVDALVGVQRSVTSLSRLIRSFCALCRVQTSGIVHIVAVVKLQHHAQVDAPVVECIGETTEPFRYGVTNHRAVVGGYHTVAASDLCTSPRPEPLYRSAGCW